VTASDSADAGPTEAQSPVAGTRSETSAAGSAPRETTGKSLQPRTVGDDKPLFRRRGGTPSVTVLGEESLPVAMGSWLGFHDGEIATLGKLAVHDRERDLFMFVNRAGLKLRECNRAELDSLYAAGELEVLQVKSDFKAVVGRIQKYLQQISEPDAS
jgi:hypothetical protein